MLRYFEDRPSQGAPMSSCLKWSAAAFLLVLSFSAWGQDPVSLPVDATGGDLTTTILTELLRAGGFPAVVVGALAYAFRGWAQNFTITVRFYEDDRKLLESVAESLKYHPAHRPGTDETPR